MKDLPADNAAQIDYWNATAGPIWVKMQARLDRQIEPLGAEAMRRLAPAAGERIIDIGCGCGQTSVALARWVGPDGAVVGVDVSGPMLEVARGRPIPPDAATPRFHLADAQIEDLTANVTEVSAAGGFDAAFSRFGVMFFSQPATAFANIRRALKPGGRLTFVCWRPLTENHWMSVPAAAAAPYLPPSAPSDPLAPGPFAFADAARVRRILEKAGFASIGIDPFDARIGSGGVEESLEVMFRVGPLGTALREAPELAGSVAGAVRAAITPYDTPDGVLMPAAVWIVQAERGGDGNQPRQA